MAARQRIRYFDVAKGIAIVCVVLGHSILVAQPIDVSGPLAATLYHVCFSFHMPLFFILSGYFMHPERSFRWRRESRELIATYALTAAMVVILNTIHGLFSGCARHMLLIWLYAALYGAGATYKGGAWPVPYSIGAIWFLLALFWGHLILHLAYRTPVPWLMIVLSFLLGYGTASLFWLPLSIQSGMAAAAFIYIGQLMRRGGVIARLVGHLNYCVVLMWAVCAALWVFAITGFSGFSMAMNQYGENAVLAVMGAVAGTLCVVGISMLIDRYLPYTAAVIAILGEVSLGLLCVHLIEDDVTPWNLVVPAVDALTGFRAPWLVIFVVRLIVDLALTWVLYRIPKVNGLFFPDMSITRADFPFLSEGLRHQANER